MQSVNELGTHFVLLPFSLLSGKRDHALRPVRFAEAAYHIPVIGRPRTLPILEHLFSVEARVVQFDCQVAISAAAAHCVPDLGDAGLEWLVAPWAWLVLQAAVRLDGGLLSCLNTI